VRLVFQRDPVQSGITSPQTLNDPSIRSWTYVENNGAAEIDITGPTPLLARFSPDRKTITVMPVTQATQNAPLPPPSVSPQQLPGSVTPAPVAGVQAPAAPPASRPVVILDAAHGGQERGAALGSWAEKDITLAFARRLHQQLEARGISTSMLRDGDNALTPDQRAALANASHAHIYIALHAAAEGAGINVYTSLLPPTMQNRGQFFAWSTAQAGYLAGSLGVASTLASELTRQRVGTHVLAAPLPPLNSIASIAVAVELTAESGDVRLLNSGPYQERMASALASAIANARQRAGSQP
jgi:N-acetylmuramoyl-L-alanine amidase